MWRNQVSGIVSTASAVFADTPGRCRRHECADTGTSASETCLVRDCARIAHECVACPIVSRSDVSGAGGVVKATGSPRNAVGAREADEPR